MQVRIGFHHGEEYDLTVYSAEIDDEAGAKAAILAGYEQFWRENPTLSFRDDITVDYMVD